MANPKLKNNATPITQSSKNIPLLDKRAHMRRIYVLIEQMSPTTVVAITMRLLPSGSKESMAITIGAVVRLSREYCLQTSSTESHHRKGVLMMDMRGIFKV